MLSGILEKDYAVSTVSSGTEALQLLETTAVDLVLLDIMMPAMDGLEVCAAIKANPNIAAALLTVDRRTMSHLNYLHDQLLVLYFVDDAVNTLSQPVELFSR